MPRVKTYSAASGYVYQYRFESHEADAAGDRYRFETTHDRRAAFAVTVFLPAQAIEAWEVSQDRGLTPTERYAVAKIALFNAFDDAGQPDGFAQTVQVDAEQVRAIAQILDL